jgi:hypothetical protein
MLFIGGPMHGQPVPDGLIFYQASGLEVIQVPILSRDDRGLVQTTYNYARMPYWRWRKPLIFICAQTGLEAEEITWLAREVLGS